MMPKVKVKKKTNKSIGVSRRVKRTLVMAAEEEQYRGSEREIGKPINDDQE